METKLTTRIYTVEFLVTKIYTAQIEARDVQEAVEIIKRNHESVTKHITSENVSIIRVAGGRATPQ